MMPSCAARRKDAASLVRRCKKEERRNASYTKIRLEDISIEPINVIRTSAEENTPLG